MRYIAPLASLAMGLASYCLLLIISQDASVNSLVIMGVLSLFIIVISLALVWQLIGTQKSESPSSPPIIPPMETPLDDEYLEISED